jgi:hypothetical protein
LKISTYLDEITVQNIQKFAISRPLPLKNLPFRVESLLPLTNNRESAAQATVYTAWTCPRRAHMNAPSVARHSRTDLSKEAEAMILESQENRLIQN